MRTVSKIIAMTSVVGLLTGVAASESFAFSGGHGPGIGGGWHGGGWHGGGWHGGGWRGGGWRGGGWSGGYGGGWGPAVGLGIAGGLAAGALAGSYYYGYGDNCIQYQPAYDAYGNYVGTQPVNVCGP
jgi:hypothetical protein